MRESVAQRLAATLRTSAQAYASGDQTAPCALLWPDPERLWESVVPVLQSMLPELFALGSYAPETRTGPALWLRCIEARVIEGVPAPGTIPIFYLGGVSHGRLRAAEDCPKELAPLVELQYRGATWLQPNGKEWTPPAFLASRPDGLGLDVANDPATIEALAGALPALMSQDVSSLQNRRLNSELFNDLVAPDATGLLLRWLNDPDAFRQSRSDNEWTAFMKQCKADLSIDPASDGPLKAAQLLAGRANQWGRVWQRFTEAPGNYPDIVEWLRKAAPKKATMFDSAEVWPHLNDAEELELSRALESLVDRPQDEVIARLGELESQHGRRRGYAWHKLGQCPMAMLLEPLARLARLCQSTPGAPGINSYAELYVSEGWRVDSAALEVMAACGSPEQHGAVLGTLRAVYLPWLESTARHLQQLVAQNGRAVPKRGKTIEGAPGRLVVFVDGLRMDVSRLLQATLSRKGIDSTQDWEWSTIPSVTPTGKPAASPIAVDVQGAEALDRFTTRLISSGNLLTHDRFIAALRERRWQFVMPGDPGDPAGWGWTEAGRIDKRGHDEGWTLARSIDSEVRDLASRIDALLRAGWSEVIVVTDHGFLLLPGGLPKVELKSFLAEHKWGRCASMKSGVQTDVPTFHWHWNPEIAIASPPGAGSFQASMEYSHGGISLQEMVTPVLRITGVRTAGSARLVDAKWTGAKCRVSVEGDCSGVRVDIRSTQADATTSLLADQQSHETTADGKVTLFLEEDSDIGKEATIVLIDASGTVIDSLSTTLGTNS
jgi:hypothetical protein